MSMKRRLPIITIRLELFSERKTGFETVLKLPVTDSIEMILYASIQVAYNIMAALI